MSNSFSPRRSDTDPLAVNSNCDSSETMKSKFETVAASTSPVTRASNFRRPTFGMSSRNRRNVSASSTCSPDTRTFKPWPWIGLSMVPDTVRRSPATPNLRFTGYGSSPFRMSANDPNWPSISNSLAFKVPSPFTYKGPSSPTSSKLSFPSSKRTASLLSSSDMVNCTLLRETLSKTGRRMSEGFSSSGLRTPARASARRTIKTVASWISRCLIKTAPDISGRSATFTSSRPISAVAVAGPETSLIRIFDAVMNGSDDSFTAKGPSTVTSNPAKCLAARVTIHR